MKFQPALIMLRAVAIPELKMEEMKFQELLMTFIRELMALLAEVGRRLMNARNDVRMRFHTT